jgi:hypothetical protein
MSQGTDHALIQAASGAVIDLLHARIGRTQLGVFQPPAESLILRRLNLV